ncbi:MAG: hypothetical protein F4039_08335 [Gammaproteobacteria bacterium]|nr:hypothetical protein [Gammaproteobacteria bacterium]MXX94403.1 hypothetical protein [Gammaproteobacteria bacterium]MYF52696.1 hypothetical protein [Gammaproteobacteria bacterium]MYK44080.1 hypothetical protein [Gammaproteobacteria bacterium]
MSIVLPVVFGGLLFLYSNNPNRIENELIGITNPEPLVQVVDTHDSPKDCRFHDKPIPVRDFSAYHELLPKYSELSSTTGVSP